MKARPIARFSVLCWLLLLVTHPSFAQNIVPNPSFEGGMWAQANTGSADLNSASNVFGFQTPRTGSWMAGESFGDQAASTFREYVKAPLTMTMVVGQAYYVEMWVSLCENYGVYGCNNQALAFTTTSPFYNYNYGPIPLVPQIRNLTPILSQTAWTRVSGTFTATSPFAHVTIGNFNNDASTTYTYVAPGSFTYGYYYIDDVLVQTAVVLGPCCTQFDALPVDNAAVKLNWQVARDTEGQVFEVQRSLDGELFTGISAIKLEPSHLEGGFEFVDATAPYNCPLHYRILQNDGNGNIHYSEVKTVRLDNGGHGSLVNVYPSLLHVGQPFQFDFVQRAAQGVLTVQITDPMGREVYRQQYEAAGGENTIWVQPGDLSQGTYIVTISGDGTRDSKKIQVLP
jgi:hypothetical protein